MVAPYGDGLFANEPPSGYGLNITDLFHIVEPKPDDPGIESTIDSQYTNVAIITHDAQNKFGGMWAKEQLDLTMPFFTEMYLHLGHKYKGSGTVADGMTFTMHNDPDKLDAIGGAGEGLGVYRGRKWTGRFWNGYPVTETHSNYLKNSLVIEFDTYRNLRSDGSNVDDPGNAGTSHCALLIPRSNTILFEDHKNVYYFTPSQEWVKFEISWIPNDSGGGILNYSFDGHPMTYMVNNVISTFGGTKVYWGFTGATGYYSSVQAAAIARLPEQGIVAEKTVKNEAGEDIDQGTAYPDDILSYTIRVTAQQLVNQIGPIIIDDNISEHLEYSAGYLNGITRDGEVFEVMSTFSSNIMNVNTHRYLTEEGDWLEITFNVRVKDDAARQIVYNKAIINAENLPAQDTNTTEVTILAEEDPQKRVSEDSAAGQNGSAVKMGDEITYDITYLNYVDTDTTITITDALPDGVGYVSATDNGQYDDTTHTVTWTITDVTSGESGTVSVVVLVTERAVVKIENSAEVQVEGNESRITNIVKNPVSPEDPEKKVSENSAEGQGGSEVEMGDVITYDITYLNHEETNATITITDRLPDGVDYESSTDGGVHNDSTHTVTWTLTNVPSGEGGKVSLVVIVNERAVLKIENSATVQVGSNKPRITNIVENPVTPKAPEKKVSESSESGQGGSAVKVGDKITYDITYLNYDDTDATIIITDVLPDGVYFVSATDDVQYDDATHTVAWTLTNVPSGACGKVSVVAVVNERALVTIRNSATVKVGDNEPRITNYVENPVTTEDPKKKVSENSEAGQNGSEVRVGDIITYDIIYQNYEDRAVTVIITDRLPVGVDFESVSDGGSYNDSIHTVTWTLTNVSDGTYGKVSVVVRVNSKAVIMVGNYATVQVGDNEPRTTNYVENPIKGSYCPDLKQVSKCRRTINGRKIWVDNDNIGDTRPPSVEIILLIDGEVYKSVTVDSTGDGGYTFACLPIWKNSNHKYDYKVDEATVPDSYTKTIDGFNVIDTLTP